MPIGFIVFISVIVVISLIAFLVIQSEKKEIKEKVDEYYGTRKYQIIETYKDRLDKIVKVINDKDKRETLIIPCQVFTEKEMARIEDYLCDYYGTPHFKVKILEYKAVRVENKYNADIVATVLTKDKVKEKIVIPSEYV